MTTTMVGRYREYPIYNKIYNIKTVLQLPKCPFASSILYTITVLYTNYRRLVAGTHKHPKQKIMEESE